VATENSFLARNLTRRAALGGVAALVASPALALDCRVGPPPHAKGPLVWMDMDQVELDAAYDQSFYAPLMAEINKRYTSLSETTRAYLGQPVRRAYGPTAVEKLDIFRTRRANAPIFVFIHGGAWLNGTAADYSFPAEMFVNAGAHYVVPDFIQAKAAGGDLGAMASQVRASIAWVYRNAETFGGNRHRLYLGGHSAGGHLCGVALVTDWQNDFGLPADMVKGGLCMSGLYDMKPVRLSARRLYISFTDEMEQAMSAMRHLDLLHAPVTVTYGDQETPEFQRQNRDFYAAIKAAGKPAQLIEAANFGHFEMCETLGNPFGINGRAALAMMKLSGA
jgi:arylformamidase